MDEPAALVIQGLVSKRGQILGRKVLQKFCYFLQEAEGVPLGVGFRMLHYGPYSDQVDELLWDMGFDGSVSLNEEPDGTLVIKPGERARDVSLPGNLSDPIDRMLGRFGHEGGLTLELLATCHFLARLTGYDGSQTARDEVVKRVEAWKGSKFQRYFILDQLRKLEGFGYLPAGAAA